MTLQHVQPSSCCVRGHTSVQQQLPVLLPLPTVCCVTLFPVTVVMQVLDFELQKQLVPYMKEIVPLPGVLTGDSSSSSNARCSSAQRSQGQHAVAVLRCPQPVPEPSPATNALYLSVHVSCATTTPHHHLEQQASTTRPSLPPTRRLVPTTSSRAASSSR